MLNKINPVLSPNGMSSSEIGIVSINCFLRLGLTRPITKHRMSLLNYDYGFNCPINDMEEKIKLYK